MAKKLKSYYMRFEKFPVPILEPIKPIKGRLKKVYTLKDFEKTGSVLSNLDEVRK